MTGAADIIIRRATERDLPALGRLGARLLKTHHAFDPARFMAPGADPESGYAWFLGTQLTEPDAVVLVAERAGGALLGYVYAGLEPQSWKELREAAGFVHDVVVDESAQGRGVAGSLMQAAIDWLRDRGAPRVLIWTAPQNARAQRVFEKLGFRRTMIEMTLEIPVEGGAHRTTVD
jgi:ribosomal protein S18 acetylase RimI-like enzyme